MVAEQVSSPPFDTGSPHSRTLPGKSRTGLQARSPQLAIGICFNHEWNESSRIERGARAREISTTNDHKFSPIKRLHRPGEFVRISAHSWSSKTGTKDLNANGGDLAALSGTPANNLTPRVVVTSRSPLPLPPRLLTPAPYPTDSPPRRRKTNCS